MTLSVPSFFAAETRASRPPTSAALWALAAPPEPPVAPPPFDDGGEQAARATTTAPAASMTVYRFDALTCLPPVGDPSHPARGRRSTPPTATRRRPKNVALPRV